mmetsp:Transcript_33121/g.55490  ORF Transcript_33121/g.55490 Transcript_33121/m.55490 type:complete len:322 (-) Transcript_33121:14-979(-)
MKRTAESSYNITKKQRSAGPGTRRQTVGQEENEHNDCRTFTPDAPKSFCANPLLASNPPSQQTSKEEILRPILPRNKGWLRKNRPVLGQISENVAYPHSNNAQKEKTKLDKENESYAIDAFGNSSEKAKSKQNLGEHAVNVRQGELRIPHLAEANEQQDFEHTVRAEVLQNFTKQFEERIASFEATNSELKRNLESNLAELDGAKAELSVANGELVDVKAELAATGSELAGVKAELADTIGELDEAKAVCLGKAQLELAMGKLVLMITHSNAELGNTKTELLDLLVELVSAKTELVDVKKEMSRTKEEHEFYVALMEQQNE